MVWPFSRQQQPQPQEPTTGLSSKETSEAIASIFTPKHATLAASPSTSSSAPRTKLSDTTPAVTAQYTEEWIADSPRSVGGEGEGQRKRGWRWWSPSKAAPTNASRSVEPSIADDTLRSRRTPPVAATPAPLPEVSMASLPPCPIAGYTLDPVKGLIDSMADPPHPLSVGEVRHVIVELSGLEQSAKHTVDTTFASHMGGRSLRALELLVNPCLFLTGIYLTTYKTAQLYSTAIPRQSFVLQHMSRILLSLSRAVGWRYTPWTGEHREKLAQRHRRLMQATNARVALTFLSGVFVLGVAVLTRPGLDVVENNPEVRLGKTLVGYQQHSEASLKWLWAVYYHHPAYRDHAQSMLAPTVAR